MALRNLLVALEIKANYFNKYGINGPDMGVFISNAKDEDIKRNIREGRQHKLAGIMAKAMDTIVSSRRTDANFDSVNLKYNDWLDLAFNRAILPMSSGGIITSKFPNYVERECDRTLKKYIYDANCNLIIVRGPFMSGKTSAIANAMHIIDQYDIDNFATCFVDFRNYMALDVSENIADILSYLIKEVYAKLAHGERLPTNAIGTDERDVVAVNANRFKLFLSELYKIVGKKKLVLFLDNIDELARPSNNKFFLNSQRILLNFLRDVNQEISMSTKKWPIELSIVAIFCEHGQPSHIISDIDTRGEVVYTNNFTHEEVETLAARLSVSIETVEPIWQLCQGHLYMSHKIMEKLVQDDGSLGRLDEMVDSIIFTDPSARRFVSKVCDELKVVTDQKNDHELTRFLENLSSSNSVIHVFKSDTQIKKLSILGLLTDSNSVISTCQFYIYLLIKFLKK